MRKYVMWLSGEKSFRQREVHALEARACQACLMKQGQWLQWKEQVTRTGHEVS